MATRLPLRWKPVRADDRMLTSGGSTWLLPPRQGRCHGGTGLPWKFWFSVFLVFSSRGERTCGTKFWSWRDGMAAPPEHMDHDKSKQV